MQFQWLFLILWLRAPMAWFALLTSLIYQSAAIFFSFMFHFPGIS
jgi:hypothetical protein